MRRLCTSEFRFLFGESGGQGDVEMFVQSRKVHRAIKEPGVLADGLPTTSESAAHGQGDGARRAAMRGVSPQQSASGRNSRGHTVKGRTGNDKEES